MKVAKFGGSSLASAAQIKKVCDIVRSDKERRIVVVSAPGKRTSDDIKVTDLLITLGETFLKGENTEGALKAIMVRFCEIIDELGLEASLKDEIEKDLKSRMQQEGRTDGQIMDALKAAGEDNNAKIVAAYLKSLGEDAEYINPKDAGMLLSSDWGNAQVLPEAYDRLKTLADKKSLMVFPGFFGYTKEGILATFPRGGSDITGAILAAAVGAEIYENFTDVDSVFAANPNVVKNPAPIPQLTYREMRELSYGGFSVLQQETLEPVYRARIPVVIKNTNNPSAPGTKICPREKADIRRMVSAVASDSGFTAINVSKYMMNREVGFGRKLLQILEEDHISFEHMPSGVDDISVIIRSCEADDEKLARVEKRMREELHVDHVTVQRGLSLIMLVGEGMFKSVGCAARATHALAQAGINLQMINQGSSEISMMFSVVKEDEDDAVRALYNAFFNEEE